MIDIPVLSPPPALTDGRRLLLASTSAFRRELLARLQLPFQVIAPHTDESPQQGESPADLVARLAESKAASVAAGESKALVIGSDQVAVLDAEIVGKPGNHERAVVQLMRASGRTVDFYTGLCLFDSDSGRRQVEVVSFKVVFRPLTPTLIERYVRREQPYQCA